MPTYAKSRTKTFLNKKHMKSSFCVDEYIYTYFYIVVYQTNYFKINRKKKKSRWDFFFSLFFCFYSGECPTFCISRHLLVLKLRNVLVLHSLLRECWYKSKISRILHVQVQVQVRVSNNVYHNHFNKCLNKSNIFSWY